MLADALIEMDAADVDLESVQTNILVAGLKGFPGSRDEWISALGSKGIRVNPHGLEGIRIVLHSNIGDEAVGRVIEAFREL